MTKSEAVIRTILGPVRMDIRPLAYAVDVTADLLFVQKISMNDIQVTKDIYAKATEQFGGKSESVARRIERLANSCWERGNREYLYRIIGRPIQDIEAPRDILFYLAYYVHLNVPFFEAIHEDSTLLY